MRVMLWIPEHKKFEYKKALKNCNDNNTTLAKELVKLIEKINKKGVK